MRADVAEVGQNVVVGLGTAFAHIRSGPPAPFLAGSPRELGLSVHMHL